MALETPLGADVLLLKDLSGEEGISRLFTYELELLSEKSQINFKDIVGQSVTISIILADDTQRFINGYVSRFSQSGSDSRHTHYHMQVVPRVWFLTRNADCRIFQNKTVPDIIKQVLQDRGLTTKDFRQSLTATYDPLDYCVQYRETDFNFITRLMEQYGIFYFFEHKQGQHTMVMADSTSIYQSCQGQPKVVYGATSGAKLTDDAIVGWTYGQQFRSGKYAHTDYNFETPATSLLSQEKSVVEVANNANFEIFDYPGEYTKKKHGDNLAKIRMEEEESTCFVGTGSSCCRAFASGYKFELQEHYRKDLNKAYVLTELSHEATVGGSYSMQQEDAESASYSNTFTCIPADSPFRPARTTPKPIVQGPQTAIVVGPSGEEIYVDKYGRVKVQFHWDRKGKKDDNSSCWIRVSQGWAGSGYGGMAIPRIGQEVIVSFLEGDPDQPIITGRVYNDTQKVPYSLPDHSTVSTLMSRSSKSGGSSNFNEIRFEDKKGSEQVFINAEKDLDLRVEADAREAVGNERHLYIKKDQLEQVDGDKHITIKGDHAESIGKSMSLQVSQGLDEKVGTNWGFEAGQAIHIKAGMTLVLEAGVQLSLKAGSNFIDIGPAGVSIQGTMVLINSGGAAGSGAGASPKKPKTPDKADDGSKFTKS